MLWAKDKCVRARESVLWLGQVFFCLRVSVFSNRTSVFFINGTSVLGL